MRFLPVGRVTADFYCSPHPTPDLDPAAALITAIGQAQKTFLFGIYSLTHLDIAAAVVAAHLRGVAVQGVVDRTETAVKTSKVRLLLDHGVPLRAWGSPYHLFHDKAAVIDNKVGVLGSFNWTSQAETNNYETMLITRGAVGNRLVTALGATLQAGWATGTPLV